MVEEINGEINFYYPITINTMCLQCHGTPDEHISISALSTLNKSYPNDLGYDVGEVRGIWSINYDASVQ